MVNGSAIRVTARKRGVCRFVVLAVPGAIDIDRIVRQTPNHGLVAMCASDPPDCNLMAGDSIDCTFRVNFLPEKTE